jgi:lysophospholipase L1-like esterase
MTREDQPRLTRSDIRRRRIRRFCAFAAIVLAQFFVFEAGLRTWSSSEAGPSFQGLFENDPDAGYRLKAHARTRFKTPEFETDLAINGLGVRDNEEIGPKPANERRIVLLGDSLVMAVQVQFDETFGELLERDLNAGSSGIRYRVINAGVQGYGPIEERLFFQRVGRELEPDLVITAVFVGNDAEEAVASRPKLTGGGSSASVVADSIATRLRRLVRRSMVLQLLRLRVVTATERFTTFTPPEPPLQSYAVRPAPRIAEGVALTRESVEAIAAESAGLGAASAVILMPARFQVDDADYGRLKATVAQTGGELDRDAATRRFDEAFSTTGIPRLDVLPPLRAALPGPDLFFQRTVHLTPRGHRVVADALAGFIRDRGLLQGAAAAGSTLPQP